ncbi:uncharacterized protein N7477_000397 [Penicillium maclennaniae]|uniref:uncharacterized protein n=1 Tax=Penicillium maclennaniae TaxID=1343394 RepID=UPI0025423815|nr:uncharacterized protein N7477_000397 [Penicillium maclennaniae]KAJ5684052.1 hypothetical protein N7477_000397 [Penicillium maclennaniae]
MSQTSPHSSKRAPKASAKSSHRAVTPENLRRHLMSPKGQQKKARSSVERKRRASSSSVSSVSSVSSLEELSDEADGSDDDADDEEDRPLAKALSYNRRQKTGRKTGRQSTVNKKQRISDDEDWDGGFSSNNSDSEESSDDVYAAVDYITDAEDEEQDVEKMEEMMILESENHQRVLPSYEANEQWNSTTGFGDSMFLPAASFFDEEHLYSAMDTFGETDLASETVETPVARRVHFEERSDSSSDSESHTDDEISGDFLQQDSLDPQLRRMIENDNHDHHRSHRRQSEEIFADTDYGHGNIYHVESDGTSEGSLSGYETDDGDTTDEDLPPPATITHPRSLLRRDSTDSLAAVGDDKSDTVPRRRGPIMGTFKADPYKPVAIVDCSGKHLVIIPAYASSRHDWLDSTANSMAGTANNSPRQTTLHLVDESDTDALASPNQMDFSPMLASSANLMLTALGNDLTPGGQDDDEDDPESALNVDDFIDFGNGSSDEEEDVDKAFDDDALISPMANGNSLRSGMSSHTPTRNESQQASNTAESFLNHLDKGIVTAFRRNHNRVFRHAKHTDQRTPTRKRKASGYAGGEAVRRKLMDAQRRSQLPF